jgi:hypothetical protein
MDETEAVRDANSESRVVARIEDRHGIEHLEDILHLPGINVISVGPSDLPRSPTGCPVNMSPRPSSRLRSSFTGWRSLASANLCSSHLGAKYRISSWAGKIQELQAMIPSRPRATA